MSLSIYFSRRFSISNHEFRRGRYGECFLNLIDGWQPFCPGRFWFRLKRPSGEREERRTKSKTAVVSDHTVPCPCSHLCVLTRMYTRVSVNIPSGIYLDAFFTRRARGLSVKRLLLWLSVRCTAIQMSVRSTFDRADLRTWSVRGQFLPYPLWSRSRAVMPTISDRVGRPSGSMLSIIAVIHGVNHE